MSLIPVIVLAVVITVAIAARYGQDVVRPLGRWQITGFMAWVVVGAAGGFALLSMWSIGIFLAPLAAALVVLAEGRFGFGVSTLGTVSGGGLSAIAVGLLNLGYRPCGQGSLPAGVACGGLSPAPWLVGGSMVTVTAAVLFALLAAVACARRESRAPRVAP